MQNIQEFFVSVFNNPIISTFVISMLPIFELRGAIPFGMSSIFWGNKSLSVGIAFLVSFIGSSLVVPLIALLFKPTINWFKTTKTFGKIATKFENRIIEKSKPFENKNTRIKKMLGIMLFVGVPLPLTGVYTGTAIAVMLGLNFYDTILSVICGNLLAGSIVSLLTLTSENTANILLVAFIVGLLVIGLISIFKSVFKKLKENRKNV